MEGLTIGELARRAGVRISTLRYYERRELLPPPHRNESGYRLYPPEAVAVVGFIGRAKSLGFSLEEIRELLSLRASQGRPELKGRIQAKLGEIRAKLRELEALRRSLEELVEACEGRGEGDGCPILRALEGGDEKGRWIPVRTVEIFSAGCPVCEEFIKVARERACPSCEVRVVDVRDPGTLPRLRELGIRSLPAVVIEGELAPCCAGRGPDPEGLFGSG